MSMTTIELEDYILDHEEVISSLGVDDSSAPSIGCRNYIQDYKVSQTTDSPWVLTSGVTISSANQYATLAGTTSAISMRQHISMDQIAAGETITLQYEHKHDALATGSGSGTFSIYCGIRYYKYSSGTYSLLGTKVLKNYVTDTSYSTATDGWERVVLQHEVSSSYSAATHIAPVWYASNFTGNLYVRNVKLEKGNFATDICPAFEDYDNSMFALTTTIATLNSKISTTGVNTNVESDETWTGSGYRVDSRDDFKHIWVSGTFTSSSDGTYDSGSLELPIAVTNRPSCSINVRISPSDEGMWRNYGVYAEFKDTSHVRIVLTGIYPSGLHAIYVHVDGY